MRFAPILAVLALAAAGCSSSAATSTPPAAAAKPPADGGSYASAQAVLDALTKAGAQCADQQPVANPTAAGTLSMTGCTSPGAAAGSDGDTVVVVFDTHDHARSYASGIISFAQGLGGNIPFEVVGVNWAVNTVPAYGAKVLAALGGAQVDAG